MVVEVVETRVRDLVVVYLQDEVFCSSRAVGGLCGPTFGVGADVGLLGKRTTPMSGGRSGYFNEGHLALWPWPWALRGFTR